MAQGTMSDTSLCEKAMTGSRLGWCMTIKSDVSIATSVRAGRGRVYNDPLTSSH